MRRFSFYSFLFFVAVGLPCQTARAGTWSAAPQRQRALIKLANSVGLPVANTRAVEALQRAYGLSLSPERVRIVSYTGERKFWTFVEQAKTKVLGMAVTPHGSGPHPHLIVGDLVYDGIQPGWKQADGSRATFADGTMMRKDTLGQAHKGSSRIFCLFQAPPSTIAAVNQAAEKVYQTKRQTGINCAALVTQELARDGRATSGSPFSKMKTHVFPAKSVDSLMKAQPDLIIQVVPDPQLHSILQDPKHLVKFWHDQTL